MANYGHIIFYSLVGGILSLAGAIIFLVLMRKKTFADKIIIYATPFAAGALLAAVFLDLLKDGLAESSADSVFAAALVGIIAFFFAEKFLRWFHHHHQHGDDKPAISLIIAGDTIHNAMDGIAIASAFLINVPTGIVTALAVAAHEIPQEIGDFGLLLSRGMSKAKVLWVNITSALATTLLAVITFALGSSNKLPVGPLLGLSAGFLLYIAMSDIIPEIHERSPKKKLFDIQPLLLLTGVAVVAVSIQLVHHFVG
jgi:zinc and cadmium transporter